MALQPADGWEGLNCIAGEEVGGGDDLHVSFPAAAVIGDGDDDVLEVEFVQRRV